MSTVPEFRGPEPEPPRRPETDQEEGYTLFRKLANSIHHIFFQGSEPERTLVDSASLSGQELTGPDVYEVEDDFPPVSSDRQEQRRGIEGVAEVAKENVKESIFNTLMKLIPGTEPVEKKEEGGEPSSDYMKAKIRYMEMRDVIEGRSKELKEKLSSKNEQIKKGIEEFLPEKQKALEALRQARAPKEEMEQCLGEIARIEQEIEEYRQEAVQITREIETCMDDLSHLRNEFSLLTAAEVEKLAIFILDNASLYLQQAREGQKSIYLRPEVTKLAVPISFANDGAIHIPLKLALGEKLGKGRFKTVKFSLTLSGDLNNPEGIRASRDVSATMTPTTLSEVKAATVEKNMMCVLRQLGPHRGVLGCKAVVTYPQKASKDPRQREKIGLIMDFCNGGSLDKIPNSPAGIDRSEFELVVDDMLDGLSFLHANRIFHSDMKPDNILLNKGQDGKIREAKIADFGCARNLSATTAEGERDESQFIYFAGDRKYLSPELKQMALTLQASLQEDPRYLEKKMEMERLKQQVISMEDDPSFPKERLEQAKIDLGCARQNVHERYQALYKEVFRIDEATIFKSDVFAAGMILEFLQGKLRGAWFSDAMIELKNEMKSENPLRRISAAEALERFRRLRQEGKVFGGAAEELIEPEADAKGYLFHGEGEG